jgi:hypothetical protein
MLKVLFLVSYESWSTLILRWSAAQFDTFIAVEQRLFGEISLNNA